MPEGDTIHRAAARLRPVLDGATLLRFEAPRLAGPRPRVGERIDSVAAIGKHLQVDFSGGITLETHMRMTGSWHVVRQGARWPKPPHLMRCAIVVEGYQAVCFSAPVVRTFPTAARGTASDPIVHLGPDLVLDNGSADADAAVVAVCVSRMRGLDPATPIGEVLFDQRVGNGIGNVYKSDVCWIEQVDPFAPLSSVDEATRTRLIATASLSAAGEPRAGQAAHRRRGPRRLRPPQLALSPLRRPDPQGHPWRTRPHHLLVRELPDPELRQT